MRFFGLSEDDRRAMLEAIGVRDVRALFADVPQDKLLPPGALAIPSARSEAEIARAFAEAARQNRHAGEHDCFLGAGTYRHFRPAVVDYLITRGEFLTAYTPYQPEISQGTLQALFEFQTMTARLLGMEVANGSVYDAATALAEAALMARRITRRHRIVIAETVHPRWRAVAETYLAPSGGELVVAPRRGFATDAEAIAAYVDEETGAAIVQWPDVFGGLWDTEPVRRRCAETGALFVVSFADPVLFALLAPPGALGADIAVGSGQALGIPMSYGGPGLGLFTTRMRFVRQMPGRVCGLTEDAEGRRSFVLTLVAREQHIRRAKATSNICSNQGLLATAAAIYMAAMGEAGMRLASQRSIAALQRLMAGLPEGMRVMTPEPAHEAVIRFPSPDARRRFLQKAKQQRLLAGVPVERLFPDEAPDALLVAATELVDEEAIARWLAAARAAVEG